LSIEKSELKQLVCQEIGVKLDDLLEGVEKTKLLQEGGKLALRQLSSALQGLAALADKELTDGVLDDLKTLEHVKRYITRAATASENMARHYENLEIAAGGGSSLAQKAVRVVKQLHDEEANKAAQLRAMISQEELITRRPLGARPGKSVAARRKAEDKKKCREPQTETPAQD
jgi:hypothetical protein